MKTTLALIAAEIAVIGYMLLASADLIGMAALVSAIGSAIAAVYAAMATRAVHKSESQLKTLSRVADETHKLVNSNMGVQLKLTASVSRRLSDLTKEVKDIEAAETAEKLSHDYEIRQAAVELNKNT